MFKVLKIDTRPIGKDVTVISLFDENGKSIQEILEEILLQVLTKNS